MTICKLRSIGALAALAVPGAVIAQAGIGGLGVQGSVYFPNSGEIRSIFGKQIASFGISFGDRATPGHNKITTDFGLITANKNGQRFLLIPFTVGYESVLGDDRQSTLPYYRVGVGVSYYDYSLNRLGSNFTTHRLAPAGVAEIGIVIDKRLRVSAKYNVFSKSNAFDFNGFSLGATFTVVKF